MRISAKLYAAAHAENAAFDAARMLVPYVAPDAAPVAAEKPDNAALRIAAIRAARFRFSAFASNASNPVKAVAAFGKPYHAAFGAAPAAVPSRRQAAAIVVAAIAAGVKLPATPDAAPVTFSRRFTLTDENGAEYAAAIENGCNDNFGKSALLANYNENTETYSVNYKQAAQIIAQIGEKQLREAGAIA